MLLASIYHRQHKNKLSPEEDKPQGGCTLKKNRLLEIQYPPRDIEKKRKTLREEFLSLSPNITSGEIKQVSIRDLEILFLLYDRHFFKKYFCSFFPGKVHFSLSTRMTKSAGSLVCRWNIKRPPPEIENYELKIGINFFFAYDRLDREKIVNGLKTRDALDALQLVFEHEICHLLEFHCRHNSNCHQDPFKVLARNIFGHTSSYHHLPGNQEIASNCYGINVGDWVTFDYDGFTHQGIVNRITRRATVLVLSPQGAYHDREGNRYHKWYVPLDNLKPLPRPGSAVES